LFPSKAGAVAGYQHVEIAPFPVFDHALRIVKAVECCRFHKVIVRKKAAAESADNENVDNQQVLSVGKLAGVSLLRLKRGLIVLCLFFAGYCRPNNGA
jgi:hypothetical protein